MATQHDAFWDVRAQEEEQERLYRERIDQLVRAINLGKRAITLRNQPGFTDFVSAVEDNHKAVVRQLLGENQSDQQMRILQGKAQALRDVLQLLTRAEQSVEALEAQKKGLQNEFDEVRKRRPQPREADHANE